MYVLPYGQMSLWGATVITNLMSAIPWIGQDIVEFIWGGFSVNNATLNRFFALHFVLPFVLAALALMHLIALHDSAGSSNPLGISGNYDRLPFAPYYIFKDLITIFLFILVLSVFVFFMPNMLGDSENYVMANPMQTPPAIVPEWYLLPFYAILRSIPNKLLGVIAMFSAILILLAMPFTDLSRSRGIQFRPLSKIAFFIFIGNFWILMQLGEKHVESPFIEFGQISTVIYFAYFLIIVPLGSLFENSLIELASNKYVTISMPEKKEEEVETTENYSPGKPFVFLNLPMQSGIRFNFKRFKSRFNKLTFISFISLSLGLITAWFVKLYFISQGLNLEVFTYYFTTSVLAFNISCVIKEATREFLMSNTYTLASWGGDNNMPGLSNTMGNNPAAANTGSANPPANPGPTNPAANPGPANTAPADPTYTPGRGPGTWFAGGCDNGKGNTDWGPMNQQVAGKSTTPLTIFASGTVYNPAGSNQPFATNLANGLAFQRDHTTRLSRFVLNPADLNFLERYLYHNDRQLHQEFTTGNPGSRFYFWDALANHTGLRQGLRGLK